MTRKQHDTPPSSRTPDPLALEYARKARNHASGYHATIKQWQQWCAETGHTPFPADETAVLRWVHTHYPHWSSKYVKLKGTHLRAWHLTQQHPNPLGERWRDYTNALTRDLGEHREDHKIDAMTARELHALNSVFRARLYDADTDTVRARAAIAVAVLTGAPLWQPRNGQHDPGGQGGSEGKGKGSGRGHEPPAVTRITRDHIRVHDDGSGDITIDQPHGHPNLLQAARAGYLTQCVHDALQLHQSHNPGSAESAENAGSAGNPGSAGNAREQENAGSDSKDLSSTATENATDNAGSVYPFTVSSALRHRITRRIQQHHPHVTRSDLRHAAFWAALPPLELEWFLRTLPPHAPLALRDSAILLTGTTLARRHQDLRELQLQHIRINNEPHNTSHTPSSAGSVTYTQPRSKTDPYGRGLEKTLHHLNPRAAHTCTPDQPCHPDCPVRALTDYLTHQQHVTHRNPHTPLFTRGTPTANNNAANNKPPAALTSRHWAQHLKNTWQTAGLPDNKRIASRSMRATGATLAHHGGASIEDICSLTDHHSPEIAATYIRSRDPKNQHITLTEQPPSST